MGTSLWLDLRSLWCFGPAGVTRCHSVSVQPPAAPFCSQRHRTIQLEVYEALVLEVLTESIQVCFSMESIIYQEINYLHHTASTTSTSSQCPAPAPDFVDSSKYHTQAQTNHSLRWAPSITSQITPSQPGPTTSGASDKSVPPSPPLHRI